MWVFILQTHFSEKYDLLNWIYWIQCYILKTLKYTAEASASLYNQLDLLGYLGM